LGTSVSLVSLDLLTFLRGFTVLL